jgi:hypothetical protein
VEDNEHPGCLVTVKLMKCGEVEDSGENRPLFGIRLIGVGYGQTISKTHFNNKFEYDKVCIYAAKESK